MAVEAPASPGVSPITGTRLLFWLVAAAFFMEALDTTILNTAVPVVSKALGVSVLSMKAVLASYTLSLAVFIPISGWMADRFGTRRVFAAAIGVFTLGSFLCGLVSDLHLMVACRLLQGCGGAMMVPVGRLTLVRAFPKSDLVRAMSFVAIPGIVGPLLGPLAGGLIVTYLNWRMIFFLNIPIGITGLVLVYLHLPDYRTTEVRPIDALGFLLFGAGIALLSYVLEIFGEHGLSLAGILGLLALSLILLFGYGLHAQRRAYPLLNLGLFRIRTFALAVSGSFVARLGLGGVPFLMPLLFQVGLGMTPVQSGLMTFPPALAAMSTKALMPKLLGRFGYRDVLVTNTVVAGLVLMLFATIRPGTPLFVIVALSFCYGALIATQGTSTNALTYADVPETSASSASSLASTAQQLSVSFGIAAAGLTAVFFVPDRLRSQPAAIVTGLHQAFLAIGAVTILAALIFGRLKRDDRASDSRRQDVIVG